MVSFMKNKAIRLQTGLTLLEALISMVILAVGVLGLAPVLVTAVRGNAGSRENTVAVNLAREQIELFERMDPLPALPFKSAEEKLGGGSFSRSTYIVDNASDTTVPEGSCQIEVTVSWHDIANLPRTSRLVTLIMIP
jgi:Tfp pilus assembly protein PilV